MEPKKEYRELLELFNAHKVDYLVVGAHALAHYGAPRYTGDLDLFVRPDSENAGRILRALDKFGFSSLGFVFEDFTAPGKVVQLGVAPIRVDIITSLTGVSWEEAAAHRVPGTYGAIGVYYLGKDDFVLNKRALGRKKDLADLEAIGEG
jgi:hypothetical protein